MNTPTKFSIVTPIVFTGVILILFQILSIAPELIKAQVLPLTVENPQKADVASTSPLVRIENQKLPVFTSYLTRGIENKEVSTLQEILKKRGFYAGDTYGSFDSDTEEAVMGFQQKYGIATTGTVGPITRRQLNIVAPKAEDVFITDQSSVHSCEVNPFSLESAVGQTAVYFVTLTPSFPEHPYRLRLGVLPNGIDVRFGTTTTTTHHKIVEMHLGVRESTSSGSLSLLVVYDEIQSDGSELPTFCQFNLIVY